MYFYFSDVTIRKKIIATADDPAFQDGPLWRESAWITDEEALTQVIQGSTTWGVAWDDDSISYFEKWLLDIIALVDQHDTELIFAVTPVNVQVYAEVQTPLRLDKPQSRLAEFSRAQGVPLVDLLPAFRDRRDQDLFYDQAHLNPLGHQIVADALLQAFVNYKVAFSTR
jgi:hypothetical protein